MTSFLTLFQKQLVTEAQVVAFALGSKLRRKVVLDRLLHRRWLLLSFTNSFFSCMTQTWLFARPLLTLLRLLLKSFRLKL